MSSHTVEFEDVCRRIEEFGTRAALLTVTESGTPHVVSAVLETGLARLFARVGPRTRANLSVRPNLSLLWVPPADGEYQMIIDCLAEEIDDTEKAGVSLVSIAVIGGILHRLSDLPGDGPSCLVLGP